MKRKMVDYSRFRVVQRMTNPKFLTIALKHPVSIIIYTYVATGVLCQFI